MGTKFLEESGMKALHQQNFEVFVETEFHRLNHDGDDSISFDEFKTCFTRFQRLKHRNSLATSLVDNRRMSEIDVENSVAIRSLKSLVGHKKKNGEKLPLRPKVKNWFDL